MVYHTVLIVGHKNTRWEIAASFRLVSKKSLYYVLTFANTNNLVCGFSMSDRQSSTCSLQFGLEESKARLCIPLSPLGGDSVWELLGSSGGFVVQTLVADTRPDPVFLDLDTPRLPGLKRRSPLIRLPSGSRELPCELSVLIYVLPANMAFLYQSLPWLGHNCRQLTQVSLVAEAPVLWLRPGQSS